MQSTPKTHKISNLSLGFTLIEMLVVVAIMATLAAMIAPNLIQKAEESKITAAKGDIQRISSTLDMYKLDNFAYPSSDQGLEALVEKPSGTPEPKNWRNPYLKSSPKDDVYSLGADGQLGGDDYDADIGNWDLN